MNSRDRSGMFLRPGPGPSDSLVAAGAPLALLLAAFAAVLDWATWIELNVSVLYGLPLVFAAIARRRRLLWSLALVLLGVTFAVYRDQLPPDADSPWNPFLVDRLLSAMSVVVSAGILDAWLRSLRERDSQSQALDRQNARLEAINRDLLAHKDEVARKNEELEARRRQVEAISTGKTQMLAAISHDVRTPIQSILLLSDLIRAAADKPLPAHELADMARRLKANAVSVLEFLSEVIDFASFDRGEASVVVTEFELGELIVAQQQRVLPIAEHKGLDLVVQPCEMRLRTDRMKLGRVIGNLLGNALKFTDQGCVTLRCGLTGDEDVFVQVADTGCGIQPQDLSRLFAEFQQFDGASQRLGGWGLGLAISQRLVRLLGGELKVDSEVGKGSVFTITLPSSCLVRNRDGAFRCFIGGAGST
jgi:signal transduction histidine kinase